VIASILICIIEVLRIVITGLIRKNRQAKLVVWGILLSLSVFLSTIIYNIFNDVIIWAGDFNYTNLAMSVAGVLFPVFMGINLARDFAKKNYQLSEQVQTIEKLSEENLKKEQEKQKIILAQNENLELQVKERTTEITKQKHLIEEKQKEILDSIKYAKRIQQAHMPTEKYVEKNINRLKK
jgi:hypothetical protein